MSLVYYKLLTSDPMPHTDTFEIHDYSDFMSKLPSISSNITIRKVYSDLDCPSNITIEAESSEKYKFGTTFYMLIMKKSSFRMNPFTDKSAHVIHGRSS